MTHKYLFLIYIRGYHRVAYSATMFPPFLRKRVKIPLSYFVFGWSDALSVAHFMFLIFWRFAVVFDFKIHHRFTHKMAVRHFLSLFLTVFSSTILLIRSTYSSIKMPKSIFSSFWTFFAGNVAFISVPDWNPLPLFGPPNDIFLPAPPSISIIFFWNIVHNFAYH